MTPTQETNLVKHAVPMRALGLTEFVRNQHILKNMLDEHPDEPLTITKHGRAVCVAMTERYYKALVENQLSPQYKPREEPKRGPPQAPFQ